MQTMTALLRIAGSLEMTVPVQNVTPAEAWLLMHVHDAETRDAFESATLGVDVARTKVDERARLRDRYPMQLALIDHLFPGRTAADIPESFDELEDTPLELVTRTRQTRRQAEAREQVEDAGDGDGDDFVVTTEEPAPLSPEQVREQVMGSRRKK